PGIEERAIREARGSFIIADRAHPFAALSRLGAQPRNDRPCVPGVRKIDRLEPRTSSKEVQMVIVKARADRSSVRIELGAAGRPDRPERGNPSAAYPHRERSAPCAARVADNEIEACGHAIASAKRAAVRESGTSSTPQPPAA